MLAIDDQGIGHFARLADGAPLAVDEVLIDVRYEYGQVRLASDAWFFEEGTADRSAAARYGGFRVAPDGRALLGSVHDGNRVAIGVEESHGFKIPDVIPEEVRRRTAARSNTITRTESTCNGR